MRQRDLTVDVRTLAAQIKRDYGSRYLEADQLAAAPPFEPCRIEYELTRRQRLVPLLAAWGPFLPVVILGGFGGAAAVVVLSVRVSLWLLPLALVPLWFTRRFANAVLMVLLVRRLQCDLLIEEDRITFKANLGGRPVGVTGDLVQIVGIRRYAKDTWTLSGTAGMVFTVPVDAIEQRCIDHIRAKADLE